MPTPTLHQPLWYAVYTRSRYEKKLYTLLSQQNVECFLPLKKTLSSRLDRKKWIELPLIPSYLFVRIDEKEQFKVLNTPGAVCYVSFEGKPATIPGDQINHLIGLISNKMHDLEVHHGSFSRGELVEVSKGPLKGIKGEIVEIRGKQRLLLRFDSLGYCVHVELPMEEIKPTAVLA